MPRSNAKNSPRLLVFNVDESFDQCGTILEDTTCLFICRSETTGDDARMFTTRERRNKATQTKQGYRNKCYSAVNARIDISLCNSMLITSLLF